MVDIFKRTGLAGAAMANIGLTAVLMELARATEPPPSKPARCVEAPDGRHVSVTMDRARRPIKAGVRMRIEIEPKC